MWFFKNPDDLKATKQKMSVKKWDSLIPLYSWDYGDCHILICSLWLLGSTSTDGLFRWFMNNCYLRERGIAYHSTILLIENKTTQNKTTVPHRTEKQPRWCPLGRGGLLSHTAPPNPTHCSWQAKLWCSIWDACVHQALPDTQGGSGSLGRSRS